MLCRGLPIPRYAGLQLGLPARRALIRAWSLRRPDVVHIVTEGPLGWSALSAARRLHLPVVTDFHTNFHSYSRHYGVGWLKKPISAYLRRFHNRADATLVPTREMRRELTSLGYRNVEVVGRGVDTVLFSPERRSAELRRQWGVGADGLAVLHVGRLAPEKKPELVLRAFAAMRERRPDARLVFVGDGPARAQLQARHPGHVFAGMRLGEDLATHYASGDVFLFPSVTETYGNVTAEAMASGLACVAFKYAAAAELMRHGYSGLLARPGDDEDFIAAAASLAGDAVKLAALRFRAREAVQGLDWNHVVTSLAAALEQTVRQHERRIDAKNALLIAPD